MPYATFMDRAVLFIDRAVLPGMIRAGTARPNPVPAPFATLERFILQRPGFEPRNYATPAAYRAESRAVTRDRDDALCLWRIALAMVPADRLATAGARGRLQWDPARQDWDYTTGQYFPVEYRRAAVRLLLDVIHAHLLAGFSDWTWARTLRYIASVGGSDGRRLARKLAMGK